MSTIIYNIGKIIFGHDCMVSFTGGLKSASELRTDNDQRRREQQAKMAALSVKESGRGAETVYRDKKVFIISIVVGNRWYR